MDRLTLLILAVAGCFSVTTATFNCDDNSVLEIPRELCYISVCTEAIQTHIKEEFNAAFTYMYMGAHFAQDSVSRPGMAKFLFESASEERGHAIQMLDYLNLRGIKLDNTLLDYTFDTSELTYTSTIKDALENAVKMEIKVTKLIYEVVKTCADDFHGADVFTNPILDEQHNGLRKLQGAVRAFNDLAAGQDGHGTQLAEYMFDHKMMSGEF